MQFKLRPFVESDKDSLVKYANNPKIAAQLTNAFPSPYTLEHARKFIEIAMSHQPIRIKTIEINEEAAGGIGIHLQEDVYCKNAELGYWLAEPYWSKGIMTEAIKQMVDYGFQTFDISRIYARPFSSNIASQKVLEKAGFIKEAVLKNAFYKNGKYLDELIYSISIV
jgi:[ribosomal protein S5]-alanine N-acetyltransferase